MDDIILKMSLIIDNHTQNDILGFNVSKRLKKLIHVIPKKHLFGLEKIIIVDQIKEKKKRGVGGIYRRKSKEHPCSIELALGTIYKGMPKILFLLPFVSDFILANVLYHEIGHHFQKAFSHGIGKNKQEYFAEIYRKEMVKKRFRWWIPFFIPFSSVIRFLNKKVNRT